MAQAEDVRTFEKGMNKDADPRLLGPGQYIDAQNVLTDNHAAGREGVLTNLPGIHNWSDQGFLDNLSSDEIIGMFSNNQNEEIYIFVKTNSNIRDRIVKFDLVTETFSMVVVSSRLAFSGDILSCNVVDGIVFWIDGSGEVGMFDQNIDYLELVANDRFDDSGITYEFGTYVVAHDYMFKCIQPVTDSSISAQQPDTAPASNSFWEYIALSNSAISSYDNSFVYVSGDHVYYDKIVYSRTSSSSGTSGNPPSGDLANNTYWLVDTQNFITADMLTLIKQPPYKQPDVAPSKDESYKSNNVFGKFFQFKYRYVYANSQKSVFSPISEVGFSTDDYTSPESNAELTSTVNSLIITMSGKGITPLVEKIEVAARSGNTGDFFLVKTLPANDEIKAGGEQSTTFYNEGLYDPIALDESNQIYDDIPRDAIAMEFINNRLIFGGGKTGRDEVDVDYAITPKYHDRADPTAQTDDTSAEGDPRLILTDSDGSSFEAFLAAKFSAYTLTAGDTITITGDKGVSYDYSIGNYTFQITEDMVADPSIMITQILDQKYLNPYSGLTNLDMLDQDADATTVARNEFFEISLIQGQHSKTFKSGAWYNVGIQYYDQYGRTNGAQVQQDSKVYIETLGERSGVSAGAITDAGAASLDITIKNEAPSWAVYYKIVYSRSTTYDESIQLAVKGAALYNTDQIKINIGSIIDWNTLRGGNLGYVYEKGDKIRLLTYDQSGNIYDDWADALYEAEILESGTDYGGGGDSDLWISVNRMGASGAITHTELNPGAIIEIFRPSKELASEDTLFSESMMYYEIYESGGSYYHRGDTDQTVSVDAEVNITGDAYLKNREKWPYGVTPTIRSIAFEGYDISDYRDSAHYDKGRSTAIITQEEANNTATLMYTEPVVPNTFINNVNRIYPDVNFEEYTKGFGLIKLLHNEGDHLLMIQQDKTSKVFVDKSVTYDNQGNAQLLGTQSRVLSDSVPYQGLYGIHDPSTFQAIAGNRYWLDPARGVVLRLSNSGIDKISKYGMKGWFAEHCKTLLEGTNQSVKSVLDVYHNTYIVSFRDDDLTVVFDDDSNSWTSFITRFSPSAAVYLNNRVFYSDEGELYEMNYAGVKSNTIDDNTPVESFVQVVSNMEPKTLKNYLAMIIDGSHALDVEIETEAIGGGTNQQSTLDSTLDFTQRETEWHASFLRDVNTPRLDPTLTDPQWANVVLLTGDTIKGKDAKIKLTMPVAVADEDLVLRYLNVIVSKG